MKPREQANAEQPRHDDVRHQQQNIETGHEEGGPRRHNAEVKGQNDNREDENEEHHDVHVVLHAWGGDEHNRKEEKKVEIAPGL